MNNNDTDWVQLVPSSEGATITYDFDRNIEWSSAPNHWPQDIEHMHSKYGVHEAVKKLDKEKLKSYLEFRLNFLHEELNETTEAIRQEKIDCEEVVDGLIDLCVVAIGTLNVFGVDEQKAWDEVHKANMNKKVGIKPERPNELGLPDLVKPDDWVAPDHSDNHGILPKLNE